MIEHNGMKISVCCPSYKRPAVKTLKYLPFCRVYVSPQEYEKYVQMNKNKNIVMCDDGIQGNVSRVRNYILDQEFKQGVDVVCIVDDDITALERFVVDNTGYGYAREKVRAEDFLDFIYKYTIMCDEFGFKMWGVNINKDAMAYRHHTPFSTVSPVLGVFGCFLKGMECRYDEALPLKEDYDMFIQNCNLYRGALRLNAYHYICKQSEQEGGCASYRTMEREKEQLLLLQKKWGSKIVRFDDTNKGRSKKTKKYIDYNPIVKIPIKGV